MWTTDGPVVAGVASRPGWTVDDPALPTADIKHGWSPVPQAAARDDGGAQDRALVRAKLARASSGVGGDLLYMGTDPTQDFELRIPVRENAAAQGLAVVKARETGRDSGAASGNPKSHGAMTV